MVSVGVVAEACGIEPAEVRAAIRREFPGRKAKAAEVNIRAADAGYAWAEAHLPADLPFRVERMAEVQTRVLIEGNKAAALGAVFGGVSLLTCTLSGIGCSSKTPAYFLRASHGFNTMHGRMPSVASGALLANRRLAGIGVSGDGDTANNGIGQFKHACRRNVPVTYIIENNGCYGLTKGQFSATADHGARLRRDDGEANPSTPLDLCLEAVAAGATFVARSFAGDKKQHVPLLKAALRHRGLAVLDVISPCVTFNDFASSTKGWDWAMDHEEPLQEIGFVRRLPGIEVEQREGESARVQLQDGSWITLRSLRHDEHRATDRASAMRLLVEGQASGEFLTGLILLDSSRPDFVDAQDMSETPLALLPDESLRPPPEALATAMAGL